MRKHILALLTACCIVLTTVGCQKSTHEAGSISGYDEGEKYLSIWVHSIEDTDEGKCYREAVESFNKASATNSKLSLLKENILLTLNLFREMTVVEDILTK